MTSKSITERTSTHGGRNRFFSRRWVKLTVLFILVAVVLGVISAQLPQDESIEPKNNLLVLTVLNLNSLALCVLVVLVARNVVKLIFDRRRGILGSRLRMRLVLSFVGLALIPTSILFVLASGLLNRAMEGWFSNQVEGTKQSAVDVGRHYYQSLREFGLRVSTRTQEGLQRRTWDESQLSEYMRNVREDYGLFSIQFLKSDGEPLLEFLSPLAGVENFAEPTPASEALKELTPETPMVVRNERLDARSFVRVYRKLEPVQLRGHLAALSGGKGLVMVMSQLVSPDVAYSLTVVQDAYTQYEQLKLLRTPLKSSYLLTLSLITALIIFGAVWIGFYIAREISVPIQLLAEGMSAVSKGSYEVQLREAGDEEMVFLVRTFNQMIGDLRQSRSIAEDRRGYLETILGNLTVGVLSLDEAHLVRAMNPAAESLFGVDATGSYLGRSLDALLSPEVLEQVAVVIKEVEDPASSGVAAEREFALLVDGRELKVLCSAGRIKGGEGKTIGIILLFDDITEISKTQHHAAWRDVARRIAHEIKNPLTPIQLSAQRLQRLVTGKINPVAVHECTQTIVDHVELIKRLANEFSNFARMPTADFQESDLNAIVSASVAPFAENNPQVVFQVITERRLPHLMLDPEQVRGVLINLFDNAVSAAVSDEGIARREGGEQARITVRTGYDRRRCVASIEVADNGPGVQGTDRIRIFEPYFTTKRGGTGLGLAVVTSVVSDHQGEIRLFDNSPHGAKFVIELPLSPGRTTQRRFAQV